MNTPNPLAPQGSLQPQGRSKVQIAVYSIIAVHVVLIVGFMLIGCKDSTQPPPPVSTAPETAVAPIPSNPPTALPPMTNTPTAVATNPITPTVAQPPTPPPTIIEQPTTPPSATGTKEYVIAKSDTLGGIAHKYHVSLKDLKDANPGINALKLQVGQKVKIPESASSTSSVAATSTDSASGDTATYTVKSGDALEKIAKNHGTTVKAIVALNHLKSMNSIKVGQKLKLPEAKSSATAPVVTPAAPEATAVPPSLPPTPPATAPVVPAPATSNQ